MYVSLYTGLAKNGANFLYANNYNLINNLGLQITSNIYVIIVITHVKITPFVSTL